MSKFLLIWNGMQVVWCPNATSQWERVYVWRWWWWADVRMHRITHFGWPISLAISVKISDSGRVEQPNTHKLNGEIEIVYPRSIVRTQHTALIVFTVLAIELCLICGSTAWFQFECRNDLRPARNKSSHCHNPVHSTLHSIQLNSVPNTEYKIQTLSTAVLVIRSAVTASAATDILSPFWLTF